MTLLLSVGGEGRQPTCLRPFPTRMRQDFLSVLLHRMASTVAMITNGANDIYTTEHKLFS
jgi:hypothetical protein